MDRNEPYHPGFNLTKSYMGRQDSATNNVTLRGALPAQTPGEQSQGGPSQAPGAPPRDDQQSSQPVYRY